MQAWRVQETAVSSLLLWLRFGVARIRQLVPFQAAASVRGTKMRPRPIVPTAMQRFGLVQDTADSVRDECAGAVTAVGCQLWPSHLAAWAAKPVAMQNDAEVQDTERS